MYVRFNSVKINNFQSIKNADIELDGQGVVVVKGVNEYENCADSNGSGKSSIFESIVWCLFGQTSNGVTAVKNRYLNDECIVNVNVSIDNEIYIIERTDSKVSILHNGNDITCKNKTDTNKLIKEIIPFTQDVFLSTVFLSQGFNSRLGVLSPSGRKERIELLTGIADKVDAFKNNISAIKSKLQEQHQLESNNLSFNLGTANSLTTELNNANTNLNNLPTQKTDKTLDELLCERDSNNKELSKLFESESELNSKISKCNSELSYTKSSILQSEREIKEIVSNVDSLRSCVCPTCKSVLNSTKSEELKQKYTNDIATKKANLANLFQSEGFLESGIYNMSKELKNALEMKKLVQLKLNEIDNEIKDIKDLQGVDIIKENIKTLESKLYNVNNEIIKYKEKLSETEEQCDIANHCLSLVSKQFRTYLLENILLYMNNKLSYYSELLFSNDLDKINLKSESSKLNIYLGNSLYETLSGGEKRKVDIAITLTQRDLLLEIVGISTNILVLDEVMDFMDESATNSALNMIMSVSDTVSSMYIISHNNYEIPYDKILEVRKNEKRYSNVKIV